MIDTFLIGLINGNTYALIALGLSLIFGVADLINFAHGSVFALGAMLGWWLTAVLHWPFALAAAAVVAATAVLGLAIERVAVRPLADAPPIAPLLSTVAVALILDRASELIFAPETRRFPNPLPPAALTVGGIRIGVLDLVILATTLASVAALWVFLRHTRPGRAVRATAQDRDAARQMGVNISTMQGLSFAIASALAGIGGVLVGMYYSNISPSIGFNAGLEGFAAAVLGGLGSLPGAVAGGLLLGIAESFGVATFGGSTRQLIAFAVLIGVLWIRPTGLFGSSVLSFREPLTGTFFGRGTAVRLRPWQGAVLAAIAAVVIPLTGNYVVQIAALVAIFAVLGLSMTLPSGTSGQISLGQAGFMAIGAYASALLTKSAGWPFAAALGGAGVIAAILGTLVVSPALSLRGHYVAIATLGTGAIVTAALLNAEWLTRGPLGIANIPPPRILGHALVTPQESYYLALGVLLICLGLVTRLQRSHLGRAWRSIREDEVAAQTSGVRLASYKSLAFAVAAFIAGIAGSLLAHLYMYVSPDMFAIPISILALVIAVLGGMSNPLGAVVGAAVLIGAPELFRPLQDIRVLAYGVLLLALVRFRPQGLLGSP